MSVREGVSGAPTLTEAPSGCSNAVCGVVESTEPVVAGKKTTHRLTVNVGEEALLSVQSKAEVEVGSRIVVAMAGSSIGDAVISEPKICDADTLGWQGPSNGPSSTAPSASGLSTGPVLLPKTFAPGDSVPDERPKVGRAAAAVDKMGNAEGAAEAVEVRSIESCSMPTPVAQLYLWHSCASSMAILVARLYLWHGCGPVCRDAAFPHIACVYCGHAYCGYTRHGRRSSLPSRSSPRIRRRSRSWRSWWLRATPRRSSTAKVPFSQHLMRSAPHAPCRSRGPPAFVGHPL